VPELPDTSLGIYLHIPFCVRKCDYCAFHSVTAWEPQDESHLVDKMLADLEVLFAAHRGPDSNRPATPSDSRRTIYVGGGTPTAMTTENLTGLIAGVSTRFGPASEISCETNPGTTGAGVLDGLRETGVTRLSLGVQTFSSELARIRNGWTASLSADLICGIPTQTTAQVVDDADRLADLGCDHVSIYDLSIEPGTPLRTRIGAAAPGDVDWEEICDRLAGHGYRRYEVSNFARPGHECRHNRGYWRMEPYLGAGPSAVSAVTLNVSSVRLTQPSPLGRYVRSHPVADAGREDLTRSQRIAEFFMLGLRTPDGVSRSRYREIFERSFSLEEESAIREKCREGFLVDDGETVSPTRRGMDFLNEVLVALTGLSEPES